VTSSEDPSGGSPLRVLLLIDGLWVGGTERSLVELLPLLRTVGVQPMVACLTRRSEGVEAEARRSGFEPRFLPTGGLFTQVRALRRLVRELRPDLVHSALFRSNLVARLARPGLRAGGRPVPVLNSLVNTPYEPVRFRDPAVAAGKLRLVRLVDAGTARLADHFHAVSEAVRAAAVRDLRLPVERIDVVHRGRDPERLGVPSPARRAAARAALGIAAGAEVVLNVGREDFQKGQDVLLEAFALLAPRRPHLHLMLAGRRGNASDAIEARLGGLAERHRVHRLGHRDDVPELLAAADLFAFPSRFEGLPGAVLEAMAMGLPVVAADIPPVREVMPASDPTLRVPPEDPAALAAAVETLLDDRRRMAELGRGNRRTFLDRYTLERSASAMAALYRRLAGLDRISSER